MTKRMNLLFFMFFTSFVLVNSSFAAQNERNKVDLNRWESAYWKTCKSFDVSGDNPCIGESLGNCTSKSVLNPGHSDEYGILMMVARETTVGGAYFCPTMIIGRNKNKGNAWTTYHDADGACVWLCRKGYTGEKCLQTQSSVTSCDTTKLLQSDYDSVVAVSDEVTSVEDRISNWGANNKVGCGVHKNQEHDIVLAISNWLPSGHGAKVRPYMIRATRSGWADMVSWIDVYPAAATGNEKSDNTVELLACKNGFKPNVSGTDCEPIDNNICGIKNWCAGWSESGMQDSNHKEIMVGECLQWRCKDSKYGLNKPGGTSCSPCGTTLNIFPSSQ